MGGERTAGRTDGATLEPQLPERDQYDERKYGRNRLLFWVKETAPDAA